jgi:DNA-directed RNA polymerase subunit omega
LEVFNLIRNIGNIDSKYRFVIVAARRTRQLQAGAQPLIELPGRKMTQVAQEEVSRGLVEYEIKDVVPAKKKSQRGSKGR